MILLLNVQIFNIETRAGLGVLCMSMHTVYMPDTQRPERDMKSPQTGVTDVMNHLMDSRTQALDLWKSSNYSYHLPRPSPGAGKQYLYCVAL